MVGRARCMDKIFIERLWRSMKEEAIYLEELADGFKAHRVIRNWIASSNTERNWRHDTKPGYTLDQPPNCPMIRDHFMPHSGTLTLRSGGISVAVRSSPSNSSRRARMRLFSAYCEGAAPAVDTWALTKKSMMAGSSFSVIAT